MPTSKRRAYTGVIAQLTANPQQFEFFQAVRMLQQWLGTSNRGDLLPHQVRFCNSTSLSFPAGEIESMQVFWGDVPCDGSTVGIKRDPNEVERIEMVPAVMGLLGVTGVLPTVYTELIARHEQLQRDPAARSFLDLFSHRSVALLYAAWRKGRLHLQYEESQQKRFAPMVLSLAGVGLEPLQARLDPSKGGVDDQSLAFFAGTLQQRVLSAGRLEQILAAYLKVPVCLEQFAGRWYELPEKAQTSLGLSNGVLGKNALSGERVWQRDLRVKVQIGPLGPHRFRRFLPGQPGAFALKKLLGLLSGMSLEFEVNLILQASAVHGTSLTSRRASTTGCLGWDTYLLTGINPADRCDVRYDLHSRALH